MKRTGRLSTAMGKPDTRRAPPLAIPVLFMGTALTYAGIGFLLMAFEAPVVAMGHFGAPHVLAAVHALTLGFISMSMMGALYQWLPVITGQGIGCPHFVYAHYTAWTLGVLVFMRGLFTMTPDFLAAGGSLLAVGAALFIGVALRMIRQTARPGPPIWFVGSALFYLGVTVLLGGLLDAHLLHLAVTGSAARILATHILVAVGGWLGLTLMGVSYRLFPMFTVSTPLPRRAYWVLGLMHVGISIGALSVLAGWTAGIGIALTAGLAGVILYLVDIWAVRGVARLQKPDAAVKLMATAVASLALAGSMGILALTTQIPLWARILPVWVLGWFFFSILGFGQKIWPFMAWVQESRRRDARTLPHVPELWPDWQMEWFWRLGLVGISASVLGLGLTAAPLLEGGAVVLSATVILTLLALFAMLYRARHRTYEPSSRRP